MKSIVLIKQCRIFKTIRSVTVYHCCQSQINLFNSQHFSEYILTFPQQIIYMKNWLAAARYTPRTISAQYKKCLGSHGINSTLTLSLISNQSIGDEVEKSLIITPNAHRSKAGTTDNPAQSKRRFK
jgi:hypothetical protein